MSGPGEAAAGAPGRSPAVQLGFLWGAAAVAAAALAPFAPRLVKLLVPVWPRCPMKALAGFPCPACGSGRATLALARFDPAAAFVSNPLFATAALLFVAGGVLALGLALAGRGVAEPRSPSVAVRAGLVLAVAANWAWLVLDGR